MIAKTRIERENDKLDRKIGKLQRVSVALNLEGISDLNSPDCGESTWEIRENKRNARLATVSAQIDRLREQRSTKAARDDSAAYLAREARLHRKAARNHKLAQFAWALTLANFATLDTANREPFFAMNNHLARLHTIRAEWSAIQSAK